MWKIFSINGRQKISMKCELTANNKRGQICPSLEYGLQIAKIDSSSFHFVNPYIAEHDCRVVASVEKEEEKKKEGE